MPIPPWKVSADVNDLVQLVRGKYHQHLVDAKIAVAFDDSKPFKNDRLNWGKTLRFSDLNKLWQSPMVFDFCIILSSDVWHDVLDASQKEALIDLHLTRCVVEYVPETVIENGRKKVIKDQFGRVKYTNEMKFDDSGNPKWKVIPLDIWVFTKNVGRYGLWCDELMEFNVAIESSNNKLQNCMEN